MFEIPKGWTRGQPLRCMRKGDQFAFFRAAEGMGRGFDPTVMSVEIDGEDVAQNFVDWWYAILN